jgi:hypothetical protein
MAYKDLILSDAPAVYYPVDDETLTNAGSATIPGTLTPTAGVFAQAGGKHDGYEMRLNSTSADYIVTSPGTLSGAHLAWTVEFWVKSTYSGNNAWFLYVRGSSGYIRFGLSGSTGKAHLEVSPPIGSVQAIESTATNLTDGNYHHIAAKWDASSDILTLYVDGVSQGTVSATDTYRTGQGTTHFQFGYGGGARVFDAVIDHFAMYTTSLSGAAIAARAGYTVTPMNYDADAATASAVMQGADVTADYSPPFAAEAAAASALANDPTVTTTISTGSDPGRLTTFAEYATLNGATGLRTWQFWSDTSSDTATKGVASFYSTGLTGNQAVTVFVEMNIVDPGVFENSTFYNFIILYKGTPDDTIDANAQFSYYPGKNGTTSEDRLRMRTTSSPGSATTEGAGLAARPSVGNNRYVLRFTPKVTSTNNRLELFKNGVKMRTMEGPYDLNFDGGAVTLTVGNAPTGMRGSASNAAIFPYALSDQQIATLSSYETARVEGHALIAEPAATASAQIESVSLVPHPAPATATAEMPGGQTLGLYSVYRGYALETVLGPGADLGNYNTTTQVWSPGNTLVRLEINEGFYVRLADFDAFEDESHRVAQVIYKTRVGGGYSRYLRFRQAFPTEGGFTLGQVLLTSPNSSWGTTKDYTFVIDNPTEWIYIDNYPYPGANPDGNIRLDNPSVSGGSDDVVNPIEIRVYHDTGSTVAPEPFAASAESGDHLGATENTTHWPAAPAEASAEMGDAKYAHFIYDAAAIEAYADMRLAEFRIPVAVEVEPALAEGIVLDAEVETTWQVNVNVGAATGEAFIGDPEEVDQNLNDPYFHEILRTEAKANTGTNSYKTLWLRLDERQGATKALLRNSKGEVLEEATITGDYHWNAVGPLGRRALHVEAADMRRPGYSLSNTDYTPTFGRELDGWAFEAVIRTTDANGALMFGESMAGFSNDQSFARRHRSLISIEDGKLTYAGNPSTAPDSNAYKTGLQSISTINDGKWHHVVVQARVPSLDKDGQVPHPGMTSLTLEFYIDGKLDKRHSFYHEVNIAAAPPVDGFLGDYSHLRPKAGYFTGDIMEMLYRDGPMTPREVTRLNYAVNGIQPVRAMPGTATAESLDAKPQGTTGRMLILYYNSATRLTPLFGSSRAGWTWPETDWEDHTMFSYQRRKGLFYGNMLVSWQSMFRRENLKNIKEQGHAVAHRLDNPDADDGYFLNEVTGDRRYINLQKDLDLDDFDVIAVAQYPGLGTMPDQRTRRGLEGFLRSLKQAVIDGHKLLITDPQLAKDLELIDAWEKVPVGMRASKDPYAYAIDPGIPATGSSSTAPREAPLPMSVAKAQADAQYKSNAKGHWTHHDYYANNWMRVVGEVEDLTDQPTWIFTKMHSKEYAIGELPNVRMWDGSYRLEQRTGNPKWDDPFNPTLTPLGVKRGEEFMNTYVSWKAFWQFHDHQWNWNTLTTPPHLTYNFGIPPGKLVVGTAVTTFGSTIWNEKGEQVPNPYRDHTNIAVVQPGDNWGGQVVKGKVFMNFCEAPTAPELFRVELQLIPQSRKNDPKLESAYTLTWNYSTERYKPSGPVEILTAGETVGVHPITGESITSRVKKTYFASPGNRTSLRVAYVDDVYVLPDLVADLREVPVSVTTWMFRGLMWMQSGAVHMPDDEVVMAPAAEASARMPDHKVTSVKGNNFKAEAARATGFIVNPLEALGDRIILAMSSLATAEMRNAIKRITPASFNLDAEMLDPALAVQTHYDGVLYFEVPFETIYLTLEES